MKAKEIVEEVKVEETVEATGVHVGDYEEIKNDTQKLTLKEKHPTLFKIAKPIIAIGAVIGAVAVGFTLGKKSGTEYQEFVSQDCDDVEESVDITVEDLKDVQYTEI